jgi:hypothetical protein
MTTTSSSFRHSIDPVEFSRNRLKALLFTNQYSNWKKVTLLTNRRKSDRRRTNAHKRFVIPVRLRYYSSLIKNRKKKPVLRYAKRNGFLIGGSLIQKMNNNKKKTLLASHRWSTKRMKMKESWYGFTVAEQSIARSMEATIQLCTDSCVIHDASYMKYVQIPLSIVIQYLMSCFHHELLSSFINNKQQYLDQVMVYQDFPQGFLGPVSLCMVSRENQNWCELGVHCAIMDDIKQVIHEKLLHSSSPSSEEQMIDQNIFTFSLIGPLASQIIEKTFNHQKIKLTKTNQQSSTSYVNTIKVYCLHDLITESHANNKNNNDNVVQCPITGAKITPAELSRRFFEKEFNTSLKFEFNTCKIGLHADSFSTTTAATSTSSKTTTNKYGVLSLLDYKKIRIVEKPGTKTRHLGYRYDILLHDLDLQLGNIIWKQLAMNCHGQCAGRLDMEHLSIAMREPCFPRDFPDSMKSWNQYWSCMIKEQQDVMNRKPPAKRWGWYPIEIPILSNTTITVARGWNHVQDLIFNNSPQTLEEMAGLMIRVCIFAPHKRLSNSRFEIFDQLYCPSLEIYNEFIKSGTVSVNMTKNVLKMNEQSCGFITSCRVVANECFGIGFVQASSLAQLFLDAKEQQRVRTHSRLLILYVKDDGRIGPAFVSAVG